MKKVIILNGPPGSGKDTLANELHNRCVADEVLSFKAPIFEIAEAVLGHSKFTDFIKLYNDRDCKEVPCEMLGGLSPRQFMIAISERFIKPVLGNAYFGERIAEEVKLMQDGEVAVIPDGGFPSELVPLLRVRDVDVHVIRLYRQGYSFDGDSRNYIKKADVFLAADGGCCDYYEHDLVLTDGDIKGAFYEICKMTTEWHE